MGEKTSVKINSKFFAKLTDKELKPLLTKIGADMKTKIQMNFRREKDPDGKAWVPLSPLTLKARRTGRKKSRSKKILSDNKDLAGSFNVRVIKRTVSAGTNMVYAPTQNYGDKSRNIPARQFVGITKTLHKKYSRELARGAREILEKRGQKII